MMNSNYKRTLFIVEDDAMYLKLVEIEFLQYSDFKLETFATGELCVENLSHNPDLIILDYHLDSIDKFAMNGIHTLDKIKAINPNIPVSYTHLRAHETRHDLVCRLLLEKKK